MHIGLQPRLVGIVVGACQFLKGGGEGRYKGVFLGLGGQRVIGFLLVKSKYEFHTHGPSSILCGARLSGYWIR
jgi:hypothetical protein